MPILGNITEAIGNTPLVRINRMAEGLDATVVVKLEFYSPANSVKDRIGASIIDAAEADGSLKPGGTIVEATSGNSPCRSRWRRSAERCSRRSGPNSS